MTVTKSSKRNDLQGIRGLAILSVLGFHFYSRLFPNGYLGVDQFFVLSGFLMCMLLCRSQKLPIFHMFLDFYTRRLKRILPLYFLCILCTIFALYLVFPDTAVVQNQVSAGKALIFASNRPHTQDEDYFEKLSMAMDLFTHTWSLSVEVQFYFIVPFIFLLGHQIKGSPKYGFYIFIGSLSYTFYFFSPPPTSFNSVFARIWQFLIGMGAFFIVKERSKKLKSPMKSDVSERLLESGVEDKEPLLEENDDLTVTKTDKLSNFNVKMIILIMAVLIVVIPQELDSDFVRPLVTLLTGLVIILDVEDPVLNSKFLIYFGDISYALYLIHWPVYAYIKLTYPSNVWLLTMGLLLSILLAALVHETFEKWYLKQANSVLAVLVMVLFFSTAFAIQKDEIQRIIEERRDAPLSLESKWPRLDGVTVNMTFDDAERLNAYWNKHDHMAKELQEPNRVQRTPKHYWYDFQGNGTEFKIALIGNSYVKNHHKLIIQECRHRAKTISMSYETGCEPLAAPHKPVDNGKLSSDWAKICAGKLAEFVDFLRDTQPDYVFMLTRWFAVAEPYTIDAEHLANDTIYLEMKSQLAKLLPYIKKKLFILDSFPRANMEKIKDIANEMKRGNKTMTEINRSLYDPRDFERGRHRHTQLVKTECGSKCELIDYMPVFWNKTMNQFQYFDDRGFSYFTTPLHLSAHGIEFVRPVYTRICDRL